MITALVLLAVLGTTMLINSVARKVDAGIGFLPDGFDNDIVQATDPIGTARTFWDEIGAFNTDSMDEDGMGYYLHQKTDPVAAAYAQNYMDLYGDILAAARNSPNRRRLALVSGAQESTTIGQLPIFLDSGFVDNTPRHVILTPMIRTVPMRTKTVDWNQVQSAPDAAFILAANEGDLPASQDDVHQSQRLTVSVQAARVEITGLAQSVAQGFVDLSQNKIARRMRAMVETTEDELINGTNAALGGFNGLVQLATTNTENLGGGTITTDDLDNLFQQINENNGHPNFGIGSHQLIYDIKAELKAQQVNNINTTTPPAIGGFAFPQGLNFVEYNGVPIFGSNYPNNTPGSRDLFLVDTTMLQFRELRPTMLERLAKVRDADDWAVTRYYTLQDLSANDPGGPPGDGTGGQFHGRILNAA